MPLAKALRLQLDAPGRLPGPAPCFSYSGTAAGLRVTLVCNGGPALPAQLPPCLCCAAVRPAEPPAHCVRCSPRHAQGLRAGHDRRFGVDSVGTGPAGLAAYLALLTFQPDLLLATGTAGGFRAQGCRVGEVYVASSYLFHDRRDPLPVRDAQAAGAIPPACSSSLHQDGGWQQTWWPAPAGPCT